MHHLNYYATTTPIKHQCGTPKCEINNKQFSPTTFSPHISLTFGQLSDISLTAIKLPDISRYSRHMVSVILMTVICVFLDII